MEIIKSLHWYIVFVLGGKEEIIRDFFIKEGYDAFLPKQEVLYRKQGKFHIEEKLMFPNYIFIESELDHIEFNNNLQKLKKRKSGIIKELKFDNEGTSALQEDEQELIEKLIGRKKVMSHSIGYIEGDRIIVTEGPLKGMESHIVHINRHKRRAEIEVPMLGQMIRMNVSLEIVKKI